MTAGNIFSFLFGGGIKHMEDNQVELTNHNVGAITILYVRF